ncbi:MAG: FAD-dependent oxidoreductase [Planctomycetota bacterium]
MLSALVLALSISSVETIDDAVYDVVVYGATSAGVIATVQVVRTGQTVLLIDPDGRLGGLSSGGLGATDVGNARAIGGLSREFYRRVATHYARDASWRWQERSAFAQAGDGDTMWRFEPHVAEAIFEGFVREYAIPVWRGERLARDETGVDLERGTIAAIRTESGRVAQGRTFIDATYEGDLLALAGVSFVVGREAGDEFGESLAGVRTELAVYHQLVKGVDPYVVPGDPSSGLLPGIEPSGPGAEGSSDGHVQAYCIRMCLTDAAENRLPITRPEGYDPLDHELLLRNFDAGADQAPWHPTPMPNRKTDTNNNRGVSTDLIGGSYAWAEASYDERAAIYERHLTYQKGLLWTLANDARVPQQIREEVARWGPPRDEFEGSGGWSPQLYVREARRMRSDLVMTEHHCRGTEVVASSVGLAAYTMDSHHVQRYVDENGHVRNEGDIQVAVPRPYPFGYEAIRPKRSECTNLLVTCCPSATHMAFGSIRMEPVFMVLGQSAATAACLAVEEDAAVQDVDLAALRDRLLADGQVLDPPPVEVAGIDPATLDGIVVDDSEAICVGFTARSTSCGPWLGASYSHDGNAPDGGHIAAYRIPLPEPGVYEVLIAYTAHENRAARVPVKIAHAEGSTDVVIDQREEPAEAPFQPVGRWRFEEEGRVVITNKGAEGYVVIDGVMLRAVER